MHVAPTERGPWGLPSAQGHVALPNQAWETGGCLQTQSVPWAAGTEGGGLLTRQPGDFVRAPSSCCSPRAVTGFPIPPLGAACCSQSPRVISGPGASGDLQWALLEPQQQSPTPCVPWAWGPPSVPGSHLPAEHRLCSHAPGTRRLTHCKGRWGRDSACTCLARVGPAAIPWDLLAGVSDGQWAAPEDTPSWGSRCPPEGPCEL